MPRECIIVWCYRALILRAAIPWPFYSPILLHIAHASVLNNTALTQIEGHLAHNKFFVQTVFIVLDQIDTAFGEDMRTGSGFHTVLTSKAVLTFPPRVSRIW